MVSEEWQPSPNNCHENVLVFCENAAGYKVQRGWLYFDLPGMNFVKFVAHSVVKSSKGELIDITPSNASIDYPFLESGISEEEFRQIVVDMGIENFEYRRT